MHHVFDEMIHDSNVHSRARRRIRSVGRAPLVVVTAPTLLLLSITTAHAAKPGNDDFAGATDVAPLPFTDSVDTTDATTEPNDPDCYGNANTVWYEFMPVEDTRVLVTTYGSDYELTLSVYDGSPYDQFNCNVAWEPNVIFDATAGHTYYVRAGTPWWGSPGELEIQFSEAPPPLAIDVTPAPGGSIASQTGEVTVSGTVYCSREASGSVCGEVKQKLKGHEALYGGFCVDVACPTEGEFSWKATATADGGFFKAGKANLSAEFCACDPYECACHSGKTLVQLSNGK